MKQAILIFEWCRPRYLSICLDSLDRVEGKQDWEVVVSLDGPEHASLFDAAVPRVQALIAWPNHAGNLWHVTRSLEAAFNLGYERILFLDGDTIVRRDILLRLPERGENVVMVSMAGGFPRARQQSSGLTFPPSQRRSQTATWLSPYGNLIWRADATTLLDYVKSRKWVGAQRPGTGEIMGAEYPGYDAVFCRYMIDHEKLSLYRERSYAGHIGVCGVDNQAPDLEAQIFAGPEQQWLENAVRLFNPSTHRAFLPEDFVYE